MIFVLCLSTVQMLRIGVHLCSGMWRTKMLAPVGHSIETAVWQYGQEISMVRFAAPPSPMTTKDLWHFQH
jgi:hypothetical protein